MTHPTLPVGHAPPRACRARLAGMGLALGVAMGLALGAGSAAASAGGAAGLPDDGPPEWSDEPPVMSRLLEQAYAAQQGLRLTQAADHYCRAARLGSVDAQYRLGRLFMESPETEQQAQGRASVALAAQRGHERALQVLERLLDDPHWRDLPPRDVPSCQLTGAASELVQRPLEPEIPEAVPHEVVERYVLALPLDKRRHAQLIQRLALRFEVDPRLALAIARAESNFDANAVSPKNAQGLMQLIPDTAERFGVRNIRDPEQNVRGGLAYLRWLLSRFDHNVALASAAYNAGEGAVDRHGGVPPYRETQDYVQRILHFYRSPRHRPPGTM